MPETKSKAGEVAVKPRGAQALLGAAIAMLGALATVHPTSRLLLAALSEPPKMRRRK